MRKAGQASDQVERRRVRVHEQMLASVSGTQLTEIRKQLDLTQTQLAEAAGLSQARISQIENGEVISLETLRAYVVGPGGGTWTSSPESATSTSTSPSHRPALES